MRAAAVFTRFRGSDSLRHALSFEVSWAANGKRIRNGPQIVTIAALFRVMKEAHFSFYTLPFQIDSFVFWME